MMTARPTLFVLGDAPADDPMDCVAAAIPHLAPHYADIHQVGPGKAMSARAMQRVFEPGEDRILHDFTAPGGHDWALTALRAAPAAVLIASHHPVTPDGVMATLRSARRYAASGFRYPSNALVGALDAAPGATAEMMLRRPARKFQSGPGSDDLVMAVAAGEVETAYALLRALATGSHPLSVLATNRRDANDLFEVADALQLPALQVRYARSRKDIAAAVGGACGLIDIKSDEIVSESEAAFVAQCLGAPILRLTSPQNAAQRASAFAASSPMRDLAKADAFIASRSIQQFADDLFTLIEASHRRAAKVAAA